MNTSTLIGCILMILLIMISLLSKLHIDNFTNFPYEINEAINDKKQKDEIEKVKSEQIKKEITNLFTEQPYTKTKSKLPLNFEDITNHSLLGKDITFQNDVSFENNVLVTNDSKQTNFRNPTVFNNDMHVTYINFGGDVNLDGASIDKLSNDSIVSNAKRVNDLFTKDYIGEWKDDKYIVKGLLIENADKSCTGGSNSKEACVAKMWAAVKDPTTLPSSVCDCCCAK